MAALFTTQRFGSSLLTCSWESWEVITAEFRWTIWRWTTCQSWTPNRAFIILLCSDHLLGGETHNCALENKRHANLTLVFSKLLLRFEHGWNAISSRHNMELLRKNKNPCYYFQVNIRKKHPQIPFVQLMWDLFWLGCYTTYPDPTAVLSTWDETEQGGFLHLQTQLCVRHFILIFYSVSVHFIMFVTMKLKFNFR